MSVADLTVFSSDNKIETNGIMKCIDAKGLDYATLNECLRQTEGEIEISGCLGQRFIAAGMSNKKITINGTPGNALGAYLNGAAIRVKGNAQDAVGDTMNDGYIVIEGNIGDAAGYAMRGGKIYVKGNAGYRAGIHMKAYEDKVPVMVIGGKAGSFLGEYQAGGKIIVLGMEDSDRPIVSYFPCTGMHGGKMYLRSDCSDIRFPSQVRANRATKADIAEIKPYLTEYCALLGLEVNDVMNAVFTVITPDTKNPYKQMYVAN